MCPQNELATDAGAASRLPVLLRGCLLFGLASPVLAENMPPAAVTLEEVRVNADRLSDLEERRESVSQKTVIDRQAIEATGGLTVGEVLGKLPGVEGGTPSSDGSVSLKARGMSRDSVQVLVDGERPASSSHLGMVMIARMPAGELERIEIVKGASAEFGNAAPVTVNLVTSRGKRNSATLLRASMGWRGQEPVASLGLTREGSSGPWSWSVPLSVSDYRSPVSRDLERRQSSGASTTLWQEDTERGRNQYGERYFAPKLNWKDGGSAFSVWPSLFRADGERHTRLLRTAYADPVAGTGAAPILQRDDREDTRTAIDRLRLEGETRLAGSKLSARLSVANSRRDSDILRQGNSLSSERYRRTANETNASLRLDQGWGEHLASIGLEYIDLSRSDQQSFSNTGVAGGLFDSAETQASLWLQDEVPLSSTVTLNAGLRREDIRLAASNGGHSQSAWSPSLAVRWDLQGGWLLRSSLGSAIKAPKLDEISDAPLPSVGTNSPLEPDRRGNPGLRAEKSVNAELGVEHYWPAEVAVAGGNLYARRTRDFIEREVFQEGGRWVERPYNQGTAEHWGVEFDLKLKSGPLGWSGGAFRSHLTLPHGRVADSARGLSRPVRELPGHLLTLGFDQALPGLGASTGFLWQHSGALRSDVPGSQWTRTQARSVLDLYWVQKLDRTVNLRFSLQNVLAADIRRSQLAAAATAPGQSWQLDSRETVPRALLVTLEGKW